MDNYTTLSCPAPGAQALLASFCSFSEYRIGYRVAEAQRCARIKKLRASAQDLHTDVKSTPYQGRRAARREWLPVAGAARQASELGWPLPRRPYGRWT